MDFDRIKFLLGGDWYDTWWLAIAERFDPMPEWVIWEPDFWGHINRGWLDMYNVPSKPTTDDERRKALLDSILKDINEY